MVVTEGEAAAVTYPTTNTASTVHPVTLACFSTLTAVLIASGSALVMQSWNSVIHAE